jgi:CNT family concentrative nucleoside transporter
MDGVAPLVAIAAFLIVTIALVGLFNRFLGLFGGGLSLQAIFAWPLRPVMWLIGIPWNQSNVAAHLMGTKTVINELVAYQNLAALPAGALDAKSRLILTCALCGFANFGSLGIMIGGMGAMVPERRSEVVNLGLRSILAGTIATCLSGAVAGMIG